MPLQEKQVERLPYLNAGEAFASTGHLITEPITVSALGFGHGLPAKRMLGFDSQFAVVLAQKFRGTLLAETCCCIALAILRKKFEGCARSIRLLTFDNARVGHLLTACVRTWTC